MINWLNIKEALEGPAGWMPKDTGVAPHPVLTPEEQARKDAFWKVFGDHWKSGDAWKDTARTAGAMLTRGALKAPMLPYAAVSYPVSWFGKIPNYIQYKRGKITPAQYEWNRDTYDLVNKPVEWWDQNVTSKGMDYPDVVKEDPISSTMTGIGEDIVGGHVLGTTSSMLKKGANKARAFNNARKQVQVRPMREIQPHISIDESPLENIFREVNTRGVPTKYHNTRKARFTKNNPNSRFVDWFMKDPSKYQIDSPDRVAANIERAFEVNDPKLLAERLASKDGANIIWKKRFIDQVKRFAQEANVGVKPENIRTSAQAEAALNNYFYGKSPLARLRRAKDFFRLKEPPGMVEMWLRDNNYRNALRENRIKNILNPNGIMSLDRALAMNGKGDYIYKGWKGSYPTVDKAMRYGSMNKIRIHGASPRWVSPLQEVPFVGGSYVRPGGSFAAIEVPKDMSQRVFAAATPHIGQVRSLEDAATLQNAAPIFGGRYADLSASPHYEIAVPWKDMKEILRRSPKKKMYRIIDGRMPKNIPGRLRTDPAPRELGNVKVKEVRPLPNPFKINTPYSPFGAPAQTIDKSIR